MKKYLSFFTFCVFSIISYSQNLDYSVYHNDINTAEQLYFMENKVDSALYHYNNAFDEFDFIFVKDLLNAAQIAKFNDRPFESYILKAFKYGLKISHLENYPILKDYFTKVKNDKSFKIQYEKGRKEYLKKINFDYLDLIYKLAIMDQLNKHNKTTQARYWQQVKKITDRIKDSIKTIGFPGDRLIGISDSTIFKEIGKPHLDLYEQRKKYDKLWYMTSDEKYLSTIYTFVIYVHNPCSYNFYEDHFKKEILKGNIHPRDVALLHDHVYTYRKDLRNGCGNSGKGFRLHQYANYPDGLNKDKVNELRNEFFIIPIEVDIKKLEYEEKYKFNLFSGYYNCR